MGKALRDEAAGGKGATPVEKWGHEMRNATGARMDMIMSK